MSYTYSYSLCIITTAVITLIVILMDLYHPRCRVLSKLCLWQFCCCCWLYLKMLWNSHQQETVVGLTSSNIKSKQNTDFNFLHLMLILIHHNLHTLSLTQSYTILKLMTDSLSLSRTQVQKRKRKQQQTNPKVLIYTGSLACALHLSSPWTTTKEAKSKRTFRQTLKKVA